MTKRSINIPPIIVIIIQFIILLNIYLFARTPTLSIISALSFIPTLYMCLYNEDDKYVIISLVLLFFTQHSIILSAHSPWGYSFSEDSINDLHIASILSEQTHFTLGEIGFGRNFYSYYPAMHIFTVFLSKISGFQITYIAKYLLPFLNCLLTVLSLFLIYRELEFDRLTRNISVFIFSFSWYYTEFHANFLREVYAFPLCLMIIYLSLKIMNNKPKYTYILYLSYLTIIYTHQFSSYVIFGTILILVLSHYRVHKKIYMIYDVLIMALILFYNSITVFIDITVKYLLNTTEVFSFILGVGTLQILPNRPVWMKFTSYSYYIILGVFTMLGILYLYYNPNKFKRKEFIPLTGFYCILFLVAVLLRISASGRWAYYMSRRATIWAFIGISILVPFGFNYIKIINRKMDFKRFVALLLMALMISVGKFTQYPLQISNVELPQSITEQRYSSAIWLKTNTIDGSFVLVAPDGEPSNPISSSMGTYAYLYPYFIDVFPYDLFYGYIPFVGTYYERYLNQTNVDVIYSNGDVFIGYKKYGVN